jgi:hypothetical protein
VDVVESDALSEGDVETLGETAVERVTLDDTEREFFAEKETVTEVVVDDVAELVAQEESE